MADQLSGASGDVIAIVGVAAVGIGLVTVAALLHDYLGMALFVGMPFMTWALFLCRVGSVDAARYLSGTTFCFSLGQCVLMFFCHVVLGCVSPSKGFGCVLMAAPIALTLSHYGRHVCSQRYWWLTQHR